MTTRLPRIQSGDPITARFLNGPIDALNQSISLPNDASAGQLPAEGAEDATEDPADETFTVFSKSTETVRIEDPDDSDTYVDVERATVVVMREVASGRTIKFIFNGLF